MHELDMDSEESVSPTYAGRSFSHDVPKYRLPEQGMPARTAYQLVHDELNLDGNPALNLASFVTSWMEPQANLLAAETLAKNMIDQDEYPQTEEVHRRVVSMIGRLFNAPSHERPTGTATIGSSEAIMLAMLAHKRTWQRRRQREGRPVDRPNMVLGADLLDERTIAVAGLLGTTFTGQQDDLGSIDEVLGRVESERGWRVPLHIDAASGGFIAPFARPEQEWDFRLASVRSINVSNHKFGLVYPGMGTVVFRDASDIPEELIFHINYLGGNMPNYSLNFSRPSSSVILQYFAFLRLGLHGYREIVRTMLETAVTLAGKLEQIEGLRLISDGSEFPIVTLQAEDPGRTDVTALTYLLRERGWIVPAYTLPPNAEHVTVLRIVVKENFSRDMAEIFAHDLAEALHAHHAGRASHRPATRARPIC